MKKVFSMKALLTDTLAVGFKAGAVEAVTNPNFWGLHVEGKTPSEMQKMDIMYSPDWLITVPDNYVAPPVDQKALAEQFGIPTEKKAGGFGLEALIKELFDGEDIAEVFNEIDDVMKPVADKEVQKHISEFEFKVGDKVRMVGSSYSFDGEVVTITELAYGNKPLYYFSYPENLNRLHRNGWWLDEQKHFEKVKAPQPKQADAPKKVSPLVAELLKIFGDMGEITKQD